MTIMLNESQNHCKRKEETKIATKQKNQTPMLEQEYKRLQQSIKNNEEKNLNLAVGSK